jgi:hypothetical protein
MITVTKDVCVTPWQIHKKLIELSDIRLMSFDIETKGLYSHDQRKEALQLLDQNVDLYTHKLASVVANNSGLSFPSLVRTTHFIFGLSNSHSVILIPQNKHGEMLVWNWLKKYTGKLLIHNSLFDLKVMYHRVRTLPKNYDDTALMAKTLVNNSDVWKAKIGLKDLMGGYYHPSWALFEAYEPEDDLNEDFINYAAIDGAATYYLHQLIQEKT